MAVGECQQKTGIEWVNTQNVYKKCKYKKTVIEWADTKNQS